MKRQTAQPGGTRRAAVGDTHGSGITTAMITYYPVGYQAAVRALALESEPLP
jgi:hypothetical protein